MKKILLPNEIITDKKYKVYWTKSAQKDLEKIIEYIADESKINAKKIFQIIKTQAEGLTKIPNKGRVVKEFQVLIYFNIVKSLFHPGE